MPRPLQAGGSEEYGPVADYRSTEYWSGPDGAVLWKDTQGWLSVRSVDHTPRHAPATPMPHPCPSSSHCRPKEVSCSGVVHRIRDAFGEVLQRLVALTTASPVRCMDTVALLCCASYQRWVGGGSLRLI